ncbi:hypothetical protein niasHT_040015 [Heterodera trifolii]|uniref:Metalloendopeptidase n=1 Tax=Heterodera trifolii TaxID=157864 RepID=A0ABD2J751_9BILA
MIVCYKRKSQTAVVNKEIAKICQEHLQIGHQKAHGFRIRLCTHREAEKQRIIVASVLDFSFTDQIHKFNKSFSYKVDAMEETMKRTKLFFIKFGNGMQQSAALSDGKEISAQLSNTIGTILPSIANDGAAGQHRTKQLHFVPPNYELDIFFQTESPIFTRWITRKKNLKAYENDPNKGAPSQCDLLGDDCEPTRELLLQIQDVLQCCSPLNPYKQCLCDGSTNTVDISEFAAPPGEKVPAPPNTTPSSSSSSSSRWAHLGDPLEAGDIMYTKKQAQEKYDNIMEKCSKCVGSTPATEKATKNRSKRQARAGMTKWTKFPIAIRMDPGRIAEADFKQRKEAMRQGMDLIMKDTCITFTLEHNKTEVEGLVVIDKGTSSSYQGMIQRFIWQELSLAENSEGVAGHELLHALGLKHEQNRDDAFYFIKFNPFPRAKNWMDSFEPVEYTNNYGFPYDYGSVMHYPAAVNPDGYYTMITMGRFYQRTIGKMEKPSFKDLAIINHIYCGDKCKGKKNECQNGGYLNPKQCDECLCPEGYSGASCDYVDEGEGQGCFDSQDTPNNLEADWQIRELNLEVYCVSAEMCSCHWRIKPKKAEKVIIKLNKLNEGALSCGGRCGTKHVEIKYRKDKRAQGALLCCASDILKGNTPRNWIEAEGEDVDIIISVRINTNDVTKLFSLTYETNGAKPMPAKLSPSCDCTNPDLLIDQKRNRANEQQDKTENGGDIKHLFGLDEIRENQIEMAEKMSGIEAKLEQIENEMSDTQNVMAEKMSGIEAKLEQQNKNGIRDNHKEPSLMKNNSTLAVLNFPPPIYQWNASDCHPEIVINESTNAIQRNATGTEGFHQVRLCRATPIQMPSSAAGRIGIIYTEYRIFTQNGPLYIGLSTKEMALDRILGYARVSYSYANYRRIESTNVNGNYANIWENVPSFDTGDVVGCGLNWATRQVFFTKNGQRLDITNFYVDEEMADFYPTVTLYRHGTVVEANFGPNFKCDLSNEF